MSVETDESAHRHAKRFDFCGAAKLRQIYHKTGGRDIGAHLLQQPDCSLRRAAGGDEIVDDNHALALGHRIGMHFHLIDAIFQRIGDGYGEMRELALFANRTNPAES